MNDIDLKNFNPKFINIKDYKTADEYKNAFFIENIVNTSEYYYQAIINLKLLIVKLMIGIQKVYLRIKEPVTFNGGNIRLEQVFNYFL